MTDTQIDSLCIAIMTAGFASYHWYAGIMAFFVLMVLFAFANKIRDPNKKRIN